MLGGIVRLILLRVLGARVMMVIALFGWLRRMLAGRRPAPPRTGRSAGSQAYQPSHGESQIVQRDPR